MKLYDDNFSKYQRYKIIDKNNFNIDKEFVDKNVYLKKSFYYPLTYNEIDNIKTIVHFFDSSATEKIGTIEIFLDNEKIGNVPIYQKIKKKEQFSFLKWLKSLFS